MTVVGVRISEAEHDEDPAHAEADRDQQREAGNDARRTPASGR